MFHCSLPAIECFWQTAYMPSCQLLKQDAQVQMQNLWRRHLACHTCKMQLPWQVSVKLSVAVCLPPVGLLLLPLQAGWLPFSASHAQGTSHSCCIVTL